MRPNGGPAPLEIEHTKMGDAWLPIDHTQAIVTPDKRVFRFRSREEFDTWADGAGHVPQKHRVATFGSCWATTRCRPIERRSTKHMAISC